MILDKITSATKKRVAAAKEKMPLPAVREKACALDGNPGARFYEALKQPGMSFICEVKRASPSKGLIAADFDHRRIAREYEAAGAQAVSVLTEPDFFQGSDAYLRDIAEIGALPLLRKDFTIDAYQLYESRLLGASAVLLICALLDEKTLSSFISIADSLKLAALVETHNKDEVQAALDCGARILGVNNRDLTTFNVDIQHSLALRPLVPRDKVFVAESGISQAADIKRLEAAGVDAVLIGESIIRAADKRAFLAALRGQN